jgi:DNA-directed RNA polymerase specialized sigma24 family protein
MGASRQMEPSEEIVRLLVIQLRRSSPNQSDLIIELDKAGFGPSRIAELVDTTPNTVQVALNRAKKRATGP